MLGALILAAGLMAADGGDTADRFTHKITGEVVRGRLAVKANGLYYVKTPTGATRKLKVADWTAELGARDAPVSSPTTQPRTAPGSFVPLRAVDWTHRAGVAVKDPKVSTGKVWFCFNDGRRTPFMRMIEAPIRWMPKGIYQLTVRIRAQRSVPKRPPRPPGKKPAQLPGGEGAPAFCAPGHGPAYKPAPQGGAYGVGNYLQRPGHVNRAFMASIEAGAAPVAEHWLWGWSHKGDEYADAIFVLDVRQAVRDAVVVLRIGAPCLCRLDTTTLKPWRPPTPRPKVMGRRDIAYEKDFVKITGRLIAYANGTGWIEYNMTNPAKDTGTWLSSIVIRMRCGDRRERYPRCTGYRPLLKPGETVHITRFFRFDPSDVRTVKGVTTHVGPVRMKR